MTGAGSILPEHAGAIPDAVGEAVTSELGCVRADAIRLLEKLSRQDLLTGVATRRVLFDRLGAAVERAREQQTLGALLLLDLDRFKSVNDTFGHDIGDQALYFLARRLQENVPSMATVARIGGEEFAVLLDGLRDRDAAGRIAGHILEAFRQPLEIDGHTMTITTSIGVCVFPLDSVDPAQVLGFADMANHYAKGAGRNRMSFFARELDHRYRNEGSSEALDAMVA